MSELEKMKEEFIESWYWHVASHPEEMAQMENELNTIIEEAKKEER